MVSTLGRYVEHESPSRSPDAIAALVALIASDFSVLPARIRQHNFPLYGPALQIDFPGPRRTPHGTPHSTPHSAPQNVPRLLLVGHTDTVYPLGTLQTMPWRATAARLYGPGAFDMKAGIVQALFALRALLARGPAPCHVTLLLVPDEEIGSPASRALTTRLALGSTAALVLEPALGPAGACKTSRKGIARYTLRVHGLPAHAGLDFARGASAIVEAAHQVTAISRLSHPQRGLTLNPGLISGGTRPNVVAALAEVVVDVRFRTASQALQVERALRSLAPRDPRCRLELLGGVDRPPFEPSTSTAHLYRMAAEAASRLGFQLAEASVGGASDGNLTASLGIPTLDGLGAVGDQAHAPGEFVLARHMPRRAALLAELITLLASP
jgi:glutamate carboxypeptidase